MKKHKVIKHSYDELARVGHRYYGDKNFCAVIAAAVINDWSFGIAKAKLESRGFRKKGAGVYARDTHSLLVEHGKEVVPVRADRYGKTLMTFSRNIPKDGRYIIHTRSHITAVRDGIMEDHANCERSRKPIKALYKVVDAS